MFCQLLTIWVKTKALYPSLDPKKKKKIRRIVDINLERNNHLKSIGEKHRSMSSRLMIGNMS